MTNTKFCSNPECRHGIDGTREHPIENFYRDSSTADGLRRYCKKCSNERTYRYAKEHPEYRKESYERHGDRIRQRNRENYAAKRVEKVSLAAKKRLGEGGKRIIQADIRREENVKRWREIALSGSRQT